MKDEVCPAGALGRLYWSVMVPDCPVFMLLCIATLTSDWSVSGVIVVERVLPASSFAVRFVTLVGMSR